MRADDKLIAIDVLLEPDRTMVYRAKSLNARLRENYPDGYELDASHRPHVTLLQRFVRAKNFDAVTAAIWNDTENEQPTEMKLIAKSMEYVLFAGLAAAVLVVERSPELMALHHKIADAVAPFSASGGTAAAFVGAKIEAGTIDWVETFVPKSSGENYQPHVTAGVATEPFLKQLKADPFEPFTFTSDALAVFQIGNFGTAAKKLWGTRHYRVG
jgi:2'-5' RNA ligase superfamily